MKPDKFRAVFKDIGQLFFYHILGKKIYSCKTVLDVGCGSDSPLGKIKKRFISEGIDLHKESIIKSRKRGIHDSYKIADIRNLAKLYKHKSFDAVVALDVIEHLEKKEGIRLMKDMEWIGKKVILLTPNGVNTRGPDRRNPYQLHKSGWSKEDLENSGYKVYGLRGLKFLRNQDAGIKGKPYLFWGFMSFISEIVLYPFPSLCFDLFAVK